MLWPYLASSGSADRGWSIETVAYYSFEPTALLVSPPQSLLLGWTLAFFGITAGDTASPPTS